MQFKSIKLKIATLSGLCLLATVVVVAGIGISSTQSTNAKIEKNVSELLDSKTRDFMQNLAAAQAGRVKSEFDIALQNARTMAQTFAEIAGPRSDIPTESRRKHINSILLATLKANKNFNGTYTAWEPNAIDGADSAYKNNVTFGSDATGRFIPYWTRDSRNFIDIQPLVEYDSRELHPNGVMKGGWYIGPMETGDESVLGPLPYIVQGKQVFLATLSVPIKSKGKFLGVAGTDFELSFVQTLATKVSSEIFGGKNDVVILSDKGLVVAHSSKPDMIGKSFSSLTSS